MSDNDPTTNTLRPAEDSVLTVRLIKSVNQSKHGAGERLTVSSEIPQLIPLLYASIMQVLRVQN